MLETLSPSMAPPARGLAARVVGVLTSPRATYADIAARPRWLGVMLVVMVATILPIMWLLRPRWASVPASTCNCRRSRRSAGPSATSSTSRWSGWPRTAGTSRPPVRWSALPLVTLVVAGIVFAIFNGGLGADATFRQVFAVVAFSSVVTGLRDAVFDAAQLRARVAVEPDQPGRGAAVSSRTTRSGPGCSVRSICSSSGGS